jgi:hypothetical protein
MPNVNDSDIIDIEPDALRAAEFMQTERLLNAMVGQTITATRVEETRIAIEVADGSVFYFYGFMGEDEQTDHGISKA